MLLGIMVHERKHRAQTLRMYAKDIDKNEVCAFSPQDVSFGARTVSALVVARGRIIERMIKLPQAVYNKCYVCSPRLAERIVHLIGNRFFNRVSRLNKWHTYLLLRDSWLSSYLPDTSKCRVTAIPRQLQERDLIFIKPRHGSKGRGIIRLESTPQGITVSEHSFAPRLIIRNHKDLLPQLRPLLKNEAQYITQQGVRTATYKDRSFDIRVLVQKDGRGEWQPTHTISRIAYSGYFNTSICETVQDTADILYSLIPQEAQSRAVLLHMLSIEAAKVIEDKVGLLGELSVDFCLDEAYRLWLIEVNAMPALALYKSVPNLTDTKERFSRPVEFAQYLCSGNEKHS